MRVFHSDAFDYSRIGSNTGRLCHVTVLGPAAGEYGVPVMIVSELGESESPNITSVAEYLAAEIQESYPVLREAAAKHAYSGSPYIYIEHYPASIEGAGTRHEVPLCEACSLVTFESYRTEEVFVEGEPRLRLGDAHWKYLPEGWAKTLLMDEAWSP